MNKPKKIKKRHFLDFYILIPYLCLAVFGLIMVYSSTSYWQVIEGLNAFGPVRSQGVWWVGSLITMFIIYYMKTNVFNKKGLLNLLMMIVAFMLVYAVLFSPPINGAKGWIQTPLGNLQPAEYLKVLLIWYFCSLFSKNQRNVELHNWEPFKRPIMIAALFLGLVVLAPDLGNVVILSLTILAIMLSSGSSFRYAYLSIFGLLAGGFAGIQLIVSTKGAIFPGPFKYVYTRFEAMADTFNEEVLKSGGHQLANSYYAIHN
ncbi:MAG: FtsW/RodA/SpoVE family cell cycle protein, partial [Streptococcaceae bacterium]|nr:FtsW/RodA/SpoVE family cell cycle protein [Streptococcaceae bacterium]